MRLHGMLQKGQLDRLRELFGELRIVSHDKLPTGKFEDHIILEYENSLGKENLYRQMLTAMITDQYKRILDPGHVPVIDENNGVRSLEMAEQATRMAAAPERITQKETME